MATQSPSANPSPQPRRQPAPAWLHARALWAGLSIITMWLAVLFVGVFGSDFVSSSGSGFTRFPVVVGASHLSPYTVQQPQLAIVERVTIAFLRRYLNGVRGASRRIVAGGNVRGVSTIQAVP
jgi:hypothetical protein